MSLSICHRLLAVGAFFCMTTLSSPSFAQSDQTPEFLERSFARATELIQAERLDEALMVLKTVDTDKTEVVATVNTLLGNIYLRLGKPSKAYDLFEVASYSSLDDTDATLGMAKSSLALGKLREAKRHASSALRSNADLYEAHLVLANVADRTGRVGEARQIFKDLLRQQPNNQFVARAYSRFLSGRGDDKAAIKFLDRFVASNPNSPEAADLLGLLYWNQGDGRLAFDYRRMSASIFDANGNVFRSGAINSWLAANFPEFQETDKSTDFSEPDVTEPDITEPENIVEGDETEQPPAIQILARPDPLPFDQGVALSTGSGFVVYGGRYVVTNHHVIDGTKKIAVRSGTGEVRNAKVIAIAKDDDLAVLELSPPYPSSYSISFQRMGDARPGRSAVVMGFPMAGILGWEQPSLTEGIVSKASGMNDDPHTFLITTKMNKGNSGGPILDRAGNLIGVVVAKLDAAAVFEEQGFLPEDVNIGIKASRVLEFMKQSEGHDVPMGDQPADLEELYQLMLSSVVLVAGEIE